MTTMHPPMFPRSTRLQVASWRLDNSPELKQSLLVVSDITLNAHLAWANDTSRAVISEGRIKPAASVERESSQDTARATDLMERMERPRMLRAFVDGAARTLGIFPARKRVPTVGDTFSQLDTELRMAFSDSPRRDAR